MMRMKWQAGCLAVLLAAAGGAAAQTHQHGHGKSGHMAAKAAACKGFVVLSNGFAVMSGMSEKGGHGTTAMGGGRGQGMAHGGHGQSHAGTGHGRQAMGLAGAGHGHQAEGHGSGMNGPLMGLKHGDDVPVTAGRLCVPVDDAAESWVAVSEQEGLHVRVRSLKGGLAHNSRANEAFEVEVMEGKKPVEGASVQLKARMPHHDRSMAGGHGLANDPEVQGIEAKPSGPGRYTVQTADFSMAGSWLFEVGVTRGGTEVKAYFATPVVEE
ncbi:MAG: FixH family protein [Deltaproteobacteria bacterium]|nr:FixH family protein [Deltaproteobacteria bacterium]